MPRSFNFARFGPDRMQMKDPRMVARAVLGVLLLANLVAAVLAFQPWGGSAEDLARQSRQLRAQLADLQNRVNRTRALAEKAERARSEGDKFLEKYTTDRRTTFSTIGSELKQIADKAGIKQRECTITLEPIEGSDTLNQMTVTC